MDLGKGGEELELGIAGATLGLELGIMGFEDRLHRGGELARDHETIEIVESLSPGRRHGAPR